MGGLDGLESLNRSVSEVESRHAGGVNQDSSPKGGMY